MSYPNFGLDLNSEVSAPNPNDPPDQSSNSSYQPPAPQHQEQEREDSGGEGRGNLVSRVIVPLPPGLSADADLTSLKFDEEGNLSAWQFIASGGGGQQLGISKQEVDKGNKAGSKPNLSTPKKKTQSRSRLFGQGRYNRPLIWPVIVGGLIVGYLVWLFFYLSTPVKVVAQVGFYREIASTQSISLELDLTDSTQGRLTLSPLPLPLETNNSQLASYFKTVEVSTTFTVTTVTTGKKLVPDKTASGQIELGSRSTVTLPAGAIVARVGTVEYRLARTVTIPGYDFISGRGGTALAPVMASVPGSGGNARLGVSLLDSFGYPGVAVRGGNITGGTDREVKVVAQQDLEKVRADLDASLAPTGTTAASLRANAQAQLARSKSATTSPTSSAITDGQPAGAGAGLLVLSLAEFGTGAPSNSKDATGAGAGAGFKEVLELDETSLQIFGREYGYSSPNVPGDEATQVVATLTVKARVYVLEPQGLVEYLSHAQSLSQALDDNPNPPGSERRPRPLFRSIKLERERQLITNSSKSSNGKIGLKLTVAYSIPVTPAQRQEIVTRLANWRGSATQLADIVRELTNKPGVAYIELPKLPADVSSRDNLELIVTTTPAT